MSHTDLGRLDLAALRGAAGDAESAEAEAGLVSSRRYPLAGAGPLARDLARSLSEAGLSLHHCASHHPLYRLGGADCLLPVPAGAGTGQGGISVSWTTHDLLLRDQRRFRTYRDAHQAMNAALATSSDDLAMRVIIWDTGTGQPRSVIGHNAPVRALAVPPEGGWLAIAGDRTVWIWDTSTWQVEALMRVENKILTCAWRGAGALAVGGPAGLYLFDFPTDVPSSH
jgi:WD domain, G-beta repeat